MNSFNSKTYFVKAICFFLLFSIFVFNHANLHIALSVNLTETKMEYSLDTLYSFTNSIIYFETSTNSEKMVITSKGIKTGSTYIHVADSNGSNLLQVFSPGYEMIGKNLRYFSAKTQLPTLSGNGRYVCMGLNGTDANSSKKTDSILVFDTYTKRKQIFPIRILVPGTNQAVFYPVINQTPNICMSYNGDIILAQIVVAYEENKRTWAETALISMERNGANQKLIIGPSEFSRQSHSFVFKKKVHSPHQPRLTENNKLVFFGQLFENNSPFDLKGELFQCEINGDFVKQLTSSRRFDKKPEEFGPFVLNMYGTKAFFKTFSNNQCYLSSISISGSIITNHFPMDKNTRFCISGDGNRVFYIDEKSNNSLIFKEFKNDTIETCFVIDKTQTGNPQNETVFNSLTNQSFTAVSKTDFTGKDLLYMVNSNCLTRLTTVKDTLSPRSVKSLFQNNRSVVMINEKPVSVSASPYIKNNRIMIPMSILTKYYGMQYYPNLTRGILEVRYNGNFYRFYINQNFFFVNGVKNVFNFPIELYKNEPFFPGGYISSVFSFSIKWNSKEQILAISR
ncbi:MAG: hypothetical protein KAH01_08350 [Caldisericia bacterium]|nr:hypothetical protein [Caldisericia bacterium]